MTNLKKAWGPTIAPEGARKTAYTATMRGTDMLGFIEAWFELVAGMAGIAAGIPLMDGSDFGEENRMFVAKDSDWGLLLSFDGRVFKASWENPETGSVAHITKTWDQIKEAPAKTVAQWCAAIMKKAGP